MSKFFKKGGLQGKIFVLMIVVGVLPGIVGITSVYYMGKKLVMESVGPGLVGTAEKAASELNTIFTYELSYARQFANLSIIRSSVKKALYDYRGRDAEKILLKKDSLWQKGEPGLRREILDNEAADFLKAAIRDAEGDNYIMVVDAKGGLVAATHEISRFSFAGENWLQSAMKGEQTIEEPHQSHMPGKALSFSFIVPVFGIDGRSPVGAVYVERQVEKVISTLKDYRFRETGHLEIVSSAGTYIIEPLGMVGRSVPSWFLDKLRGSEKGWAVGIDEHDRHAIKGFYRSGFNGWYIVLNEEVEEIYQSLNSLMLMAAGPGFLTVIILAFIWFSISRRMILTPISKLSEGAYEIGHGRFEHRLELKTGDELEELANEFNFMAEKLSASRQKLERWNEDLRTEVAKRTVELEDANEELRVSKDEMEKYLQQVISLNDELALRREELSKRNDDLANANTKLREMDRLKSEFLANMSHELRTPLTAIIGFSELLVDQVMGEMTEEQLGCVDNILTSGQHLLKLINDILDLSKIEAGRMELHPEKFNLGTIISFVVKTVSSLSEKKGQEIKLEMAGNLPDMCADPGKVKQLLLNLVGNAIKFTPQGGTITISATFKEDRFYISVKDTGIGIKPEDREKVFLEFRQAEGSTSREYGGTGLGLTLTKRLVEMHGGRIDLESEPGKGSTFTVMIPMAGEPVFGLGQHSEVPADTTVEMKAAEPATKGGTNPLVLVVEDDPKLSKLLSVYLEQAGYQVETAFDGQEAINKARELRPFAITLDVMLPKKDGWEVLQELKTFPETKGIPVTIVSMVENQDLGFSLGAADYLVKPINREELLGSLGRFTFTTKVKEGNIKVLVVDDDPKILEFLSTSLGKAGFQVVTAAGGEEGIAKALNEVPDLIVLDLMMPKVGGMEVIKELKAHELTMDIPVFILTAKDLTRDEKELLQKDASRIFQKGVVAKEELLQEIRRVEISNPERAGLVDSVTDLLNHRYFINRLSHELGRSQRYRRVLSAALVEIDSFGYFAEVNGRFHGDAMLREMGRVITRHLRKADLATYYGDGRFGLIFPETGKSAVLAVAEKFRQLSEEYPFQKRESLKSGRVTVSVSVITYPGDGETISEIVDGLASAVADAVKSGGNRVVDAKKGVRGVR